jgi:hypothetical protein
VLLIASVGLAFFDPDLVGAFTDAMFVRLAVALFGFSIARPAL